MMVLIFLPILFLAIVIHEFAHGWVAYKLGDPTAKYAGRLTLNPLAHVDPIGTVLVPILLILASSLPGAKPIIIGWAKPVPINPTLLRRPRRDMIWVSMAGIGANFLSAFSFSILLNTGLFPINSYGWSFLNFAILINLVLAVFNAVPIPPLDGSKILASILPPDLAGAYMQLERYGFLILLTLLWLGILGRFIWPVVIVLGRILGATV